MNASRPVRTNSPFRLLHAANRSPGTWKNGGGATAQVAAFPSDAALQGFDWRVSIARVESAGPFSQFPGIDRTLAVLDGAGMVLQVEQRAAVTLTRSSMPHAFPGDVATSARLIGGTICDLNVMTRRGAYTHTLQRLQIVGSQQLQVDQGTSLLLSRARGLQIGSGGMNLRLERDDALMIEGCQTMQLQASVPSEVWQITILPV